MGSIFAFETAHIMTKLSPQDRSRNSRLSLGLLAVSLLLGTWIRVHGSVVYPFLADESRITQSGVRDMFGMGPDRMRVQAGPDGKGAGD